MSEDIFNFEKLIVYQKSLDYLDFAYELSDKFPSHENFRLSDQFKRAALSISLNIADGAGGTKKEFSNYLRISRRSAKECLVCTTVAFRRKYISEAENKESRSRVTEIAKMISGLRNSLK